MQEHTSAEILKDFGVAISVYKSGDPILLGMYQFRDDAVPKLYEYLEMVRGSEGNLINAMNSINRKDARQIGWCVGAAAYKAEDVDFLTRDLDGGVASVQPNWQSKALEFFKHRPIYVTVKQCNEILTNQKCTDMSVLAQSEKVDGLIAAAAKYNADTKKQANDNFVITGEKLKPALPIGLFGNKVGVFSYLTKSDKLSAAANFIQKKTAGARSEYLVSRAEGYMKSFALKYERPKELVTGIGM
jgi:hypothetical protein